MEKEGRKRFRAAEELGDELLALDRPPPGRTNGTAKRKAITPKEVTIKLNMKKAARPMFVSLVVIAAIFAGIKYFKPIIIPEEPVVQEPLSDAEEAVPEREIKNSAVEKFLAPLLREAVKSMKEEDFNKFENVIGTLENQIPEGESLRLVLDKIRENYQAGRKFQKAGDLNASRKSYTRSRSEMNRLLAFINEKDSADSARAALEESKKAAEFYALSAFLYKKFKDITMEKPKTPDQPMKTKILFVCYGNTCRSPMAEGLARKIMGDRVLAESAGVSPSPAYARAADDAVLVMKTLYGTDISGHKPRSVSKVDLSAYDYVIALDFTVYKELKEKGLVPEAKLFGWDIDDPIGQGYGAYKQAAKKIESRLIQFLDNEGIVY